MRKLKFLKALNSPFKPFKLSFYCGKTELGVPYFLPRKWVKATPELAHKATLDYLESEKRFNENNPKYARKVKLYSEVYKEKLTHQYAVPRKVGFDFCGLGWKTKWDETDYRFEWSPRLSFVFFGFQIAITVVVSNPDEYWTAWLYYERDTDKTKSKKERINQCMEEFPQIFTSHYPDGKTETIDYYTKILKPKYLKK